MMSEFINQLDGRKRGFHPDPSEVLSGNALDLHTRCGRIDDAIDHDHDTCSPQET